jgi:cobalamin biosynthesis protein CobT
MKTLEVTDEQYAFIQYLREEISESVVGKYGFVRERDAVQFLVDNLDEDIEIDADEFDSSATDDVAASVGAAIDGETDPHDLEEVSYVEGETPAADEIVDEDSEDPESESDEATDGDADDGPADDGTSEVTEGEPDDEDEADDEAADGDGSADETDGDGSADDDDMLDEMMSLLETHDDKWDESSSADYRYSVELPDGSSEQVQTKDDVRALLFKNYR